MKRFWLITILSITALILSACTPAAATTPNSLPTQTVDEVLATVTPGLAQPSATASGGKLISRNGVEFIIPSGLGVDATSSIVPERAYVEDGPPSGNPAYMQFKLQGYPVPGSEYFYAEIQVYDAKAYAADFVAGGPNSKALNNLLAVPDAPLTQKSMPPSYLMMASNMKRLFSANLKGIRMLSIHGNGAVMVTNSLLSYQFHGLTADEKFYIIVNLPVTAPFLPADYDTPASDGLIMPNDDNMDTYLPDVTSRLDVAEISGTLSPSLALLDELVQSLKINTAEIILPAPLPTNIPNVVVDEPTPTTAPASSTPCDGADFVKDVTYPDGTQVNAGEAFIKSWSIKNTGSCTWDENYTLVFMSGDQLGGTSPADVLAGSNVLPGGVVDVSIPMQAPTEKGTYLGYWALYNAAGEPVKTLSGNPFQITVNIVVP